MRRLKVLLAGMASVSMVGLMPLGLTAQAEGDDPADASLEAPAAVAAIKDLVYATGRTPDDASERMLTAYVPAGRTDVPMVLDAGWALADPWALAEQGVAVFLANTPDRWREIAVDSDPEALRAMAETVACAVRFARGWEFGSETAPLVLTGFSRHGATATHVALAGESFDQLWADYAASAGGPPAQYDCAVSGGSTRVDGLVGVAGPYDNVVGYDGSSYDSPFARDFLQQHQPGLWEMLWSTVGLHPELRVRLLHGDADSGIPLQSSAVFEDVLAEAGYDVELVEFEGGHSVPYDLLVGVLLDLIE